MADFKNLLGKPGRVSHTISSTKGSLNVPKNSNTKKASQTSPVPLKPCTNCRGSGR